MNKTFNISRKLTGISKKLYSKGQGMTEYLIIVGVIAVAAITAFSYFGAAIRGTAGGLASEIAGSSGKAGQTAAQAAALSAVGESDKSIKMGNYTEGGGGTAAVVPPK